MAGFSSSPDFPLTFLSREEEINEASNVAASNERVRRLFEAMMDDGYHELRINGEYVYLESSKDADIAYRLFLASPQPNQDFRREQAKAFFRDGKLLKSAA